MKRFVLTALMFLVASCGAPTESANDVNAIFDRDTLNLDAKVMNLCQTLNTNESGPSLKGMDINMFGCRDAGTMALSYKSMKAFYFSGMENLGGGKDDEVVSINTRSQVWLGDSLLGLAGLIGPALEKKAAQDKNEEEEEGKTGGVTGLVKPKIEKGEASFDKEAMRFSIDIGLELTGFVTVKQKFQISGQLIDNAVAVTIKSTEKPSYKDSLVRSIEAVVFIVPHAADVYVDLFVHAEVYRLGFTDNVLVDQLESFLGSGMKSGLDTVLAL